MYKKIIYSYKKLNQNHIIILNENKRKIIFLVKIRKIN